MKKKVIMFMGQEYPVHGAEGAVCDMCRRTDNSGRAGFFRWHHGLPVGYFCDEHWEQMLASYKSS